MGNFFSKIKKKNEYKYLLDKCEELCLIGIYKWNIETNELFWTDGLKEIYETKECTFENYMEKNHPDDRERIIKVIEKCLETKRDFIIEHKLLINNKVKYLYAKGGFKKINGINYIIGIAQDITIQKQVEENLIKEKLISENLSKTKSSFIANMSHEIRTPINGIIGMTNLLKELNLTNEQKEYVDIICHSSGVLLSIINNVLDFEKIESGNMINDCNNINVRQFINKIHNSFNYKLNEKELLYNCYIDKKVPEIICLDELKLTQILNNLINNSIKFTDYGSISIIIIMVNKNISFEIKDTGIGISHKDQLNLFKPFVQIEQVKKYEGTGLGLSICKNLVEILDGKISMKSLKDVGTSIIFELPLQQYVKEKDIKEENIKEEDIKEDVKEDVGICIAVVEDNKINQMVLRKTLEKLNYRNIKFYENGSEIVKDIRKSKIDIILMDLHMPIMDGYKCTEKLRKLGYKIPIVAITANSMVGEKDKCLKIGMDDFVLKPIQLYKFKEILEKWIE